MTKYDLAVVGAGLGGLAVAALASRMNKKTVVLEPGESVGGVLEPFCRDGFTFSSSPALSFGFERGGSVQALGEALGIVIDASVHSPCYQVALPGRRITVFAEQNETLEELRREFPDEIDGIASFSRDLKKAAEKSAKSRLSAYLAQRRSAAGFFRKYRFSAELTAFFNAQSAYFFGRPVSAISLASLLQLCASAPFLVTGGFGKIADQMLSELLKNGGEIRYQTPLSEIAIKQGTTAGLSTPSGFLDADAILFNTEKDKRGPVFFIGIREEAVPVGMAQNVLCLPDYSLPERVFALSLSAKGDESAAPRGMRTLTASACFLSGAAERDELTRVIGRLMPFLDQHLLFREEQSAAPRSHVFPQGMSFKPIRTGDSRAILSKASVKDVYLIPDGSGTPAQAIAAARSLIARLH